MNADLSYGEILRLTDGHGTSELYERVQALQARLANAHADETGHLHRCAKVNGRWACATGCAVARAETAEAQAAALAQFILEGIEEWSKGDIDTGGLIAGIERAALAAASPPSYCTRYVSGEGRHRVQAVCPLAPGVACAPEENGESPGETRDE